MPTTASVTFSATQLMPALDPDEAGEVHVQIAPSLTLAAGTVLGEITASPGVYKAYASGNSDGSEVPKAILRYAATTDASGNITWFDSRQTVKSVPAYYRGNFKASELVGLDANAVTKLAARFIRGGVGVAGAILHIG